MKYTSGTNGYLTFSKKERRGILLLLAIIVATVLLPYWWSVQHTIVNAPVQFDAATKAKLELLHISNKKTTSTTTEFKQSESGHRLHLPFPNHAPTVKASFFYFDPNLASAANWQQLGVKPKTIQTIQHYLAKGGRFKQPEDIKKIYGLSVADYERLLPYVSIKPVASSNTIASRSYAQNIVPQKKIHSKLLSIDINTADTNALIALPGIGSKLAARIVLFREKLGGFYSIDQIAETYGLADSVFLKISPYLQYTNNNAQLKFISINLADAATLSKHPYINYRLANAIVQYRQQHGPFKQVEDLQQIMLITSQVYNKLLPYLILD
jgi:DNA uptake protein ComE-like DNA-binding protein